MRRHQENATAARRDGPHRVGIVVFDGVKMLDVAGPSEVFAESNRLGATYQLVVCSVGAATVTSSTGMRMTAGIDLALALVEDDHGDDLARQVAQSLVVFLQRPGGQSQFSPALQRSRPRAPLLRAVVDAVAADPTADHSVASLAATALVSPRQLTRLFHDELGVTPARYVDEIRFATAKAALEAGYGVGEAAGRAGYRNPESLRRAFVSRLGIPPQAYQQRFRSTRRPLG